MRHKMFSITRINRTSKVVSDENLFPVHSTAKISPNYPIQYSLRIVFIVLLLVCIRLPVITISFVRRFYLLSFFAIGTIILLLSSMFANTVATTGYAQFLPKIKTNSNSTTGKTSLLPPSSSSLASLVHPKLHTVKITSPTKGQQIPAGSNLMVAGTATDNGTMTPDCEVSVIVNGIKPYQKAVPTGHIGPNAYSTWNYMLTPTYVAIKQGQNKITAKFSCSSDPSLTSHNSVNVTGVANRNTPLIAPISSHSSSASQNSNHKLKLLSISFDLSKNPISSGGNQTINTRVLDAANSNVTIAGARVNGSVTNPSNTTVTSFNGTTNKSGIFSYSWKISKEYKPGTFTISVYGTANGYQNQLSPTKMTFDVISAAHKTNSKGSNSTHHTVHTVHSPGSSSSAGGSRHPSSIIHIPNIRFPHIHFPKIPSFS